MMCRGRARIFAPVPRCGPSAANFDDQPPPRPWPMGRPGGGGRDSKAGAGPPTGQRLRFVAASPHYARNRRPKSQPPRAVPGIKIVKGREGPLCSTRAPGYRPPAARPIMAETSTPPSQPRRPRTGSGPLAGQLGGGGRPHTTLLCPAVMLGFQASDMYGQFALPPQGAPGRAC